MTEQVLIIFIAPACSNLMQAHDMCLLMVVTNAWNKAEMEWSLSVGQPLNVPQQEF